VADIRIGRQLPGQLQVHLPRDPGLKADKQLRGDEDAVRGGGKLENMGKERTQKVK
jgi:hypothetical protein